jgi:hypothetical protein
MSLSSVVDSTAGHHPANKGVLPSRFQRQRLLVEKARNFQALTGWKPAALPLSTFSRDSVLARASLEAETNGEDILLFVSPRRMLLEVDHMKTAPQFSPLWALGVAISLVIIFAARVQTAPPSHGESSAIAGELTTLMTGRHLDAIAAQDSDHPDRFVAALLIPGAQLLVVSATYPNAGELQAQIAQKNYRDVYAALQQPVAQQTRVFFIDAAGDGLRSGGDAVDVMYEKGTQQTLFDGRWKPQGLTEAAYTKKVDIAEEEYSRLLSLLTATLKGESTGHNPGADGYLR